MTEPGLYFEIKDSRARIDLFAEPYVVWREDSLAIESIVASNDYVFVTHWSFTGDCQTVYEILRDPLDLTRWWPEVYLSVVRTSEGDASGIGSVFKLHTKGFLPYTLTWEFQVDEVVESQRIALSARGDFVGKGVWTFTQDGPTVHVKYDWRIRADKPLLKRLSFLMKPIFSANHRWAMEKGRLGLERELHKRKALST